MRQFPRPLQDLIKLLRDFPGVGLKTAERYAFHLVKLPQEKRQQITETIQKAGESMRHCQLCGQMDTQNPCTICTDPKRDPATICVVSDQQDIVAIEKTGEFNGRYHVLGGVLNPLEGITPDSLSIKSLLHRIQETKPHIKEVIIATNPDLEGESTAMYLARNLKSLRVRVTRLARGLPVGASIEYADEITLSSALKERKEV